MFFRQYLPESSSNKIKDHHAHIEYFFHGHLNEITPDEFFKRLLKTLKDKQGQIFRKQ